MTPCQTLLLAKNSLDGLYTVCFITSANLLYAHNSLVLLAYNTAGGQPISLLLYCTVLRLSIAIILAITYPVIL